MKLPRLIISFCFLLVLNSPASEPEDYHTSKKALMKEGDSPFIEYLDESGVKRRAWLTETDYSSGKTPFQHTDDPDWKEMIPATPNTTGQLGQLPYTAFDGTIWKVSVESSYTSDGPGAREAIISKMKFMHLDGSNDHRDTVLAFTGWDGKGWDATINPTFKDFPKQPWFHLTRRK